MTDTGAEEAKLPFQLEQTFADSLAQLDALKRILLLLQGEAYLAASIDSLIRKDSLTTAFLHLGQQYRWANLRNGNVETAFLSQVGFRERLYSNQLFQYQEVRQLQEALLNHAENNGYPFASVWLDSIEIKDNRVSAQIFMQRNRLFLIEAINIIGDAKISSAYLENYLGLQAGSLYSKEKILKIRNRIRELPFLQEKRDVTITFAGDRATVNLFLADKKASRFDFLIGLQPRTQVATGNQPEVRTFQLTGTFNADLHNQFGWGERIFAEFQQLRPETQELNLQFVYPYLLNLPFGTDLKFDLYKRDTSYLDVIIDVGVQYLFEGGNYLKAFWNNTSTAILNIDEATILAQKRLPQNLDVSRSTFGLEYQVQRLDYRFNPRKGWSALLRGGAGIKKIKRNSEILELAGGDFNPALIYDTLNLSTFQYQFTGNLAYYIPLFKRTTIKTSLQGGLIIAEEDIYQNEQFRIGGNRILRGFDEESIFASNYAVLTTELRFLIGLNSYFYAFGDFAYVENVTTERRNFDRPIGMGAGITFETKVGLFGFSLAVGRQQGNPFDFRSVKTHFGYVSLF
ncbi:MAG: BamA/TamA family outer membrane protein [Bacteroidota bacterium]